jgi:hypothetical protein
MPFKEYDVVRLREPLPDSNMPIGSRGIVLIVYDEPHPAYDVEFIDGASTSLGVFTVQERYLEEESLELEIPGYAKAVLEHFKEWVQTYYNGY